MATLEIGHLVIGHLVDKWGGDTYIHDFHLDNQFGARVKPHNEEYVASQKLAMWTTLTKKNESCPQ